MGCSASTATATERAKASQPHVACRYCGRKVLQVVFDMHEATCSARLGAGAGAGAGTSAAAAGAAPAHIPTAPTASAQQLIQAADKAECWYCHQHVLLSIIEDHIDVCLLRSTATPATSQSSTTTPSFASTYRRVLGGSSSGSGSSSSATTPQRDLYKYGGLWPGPIGSQSRLELVNQSSEAGRAVVAGFRATCSSTIVAVWRVRNPTLRAHYDLMHKHMQERLGPATQCERTLFHGTQPSTVPQICERGFNRSYCGRNATAYGKGVYFAVAASYSSSTMYSPKNRGGVQHMFMARVLVGRVGQGHSGLLAPPPVSRGSLTLFDSVSDSPRHPNMFVVFQDAQAFPEYVIAFK